MFSFGKDYKLNFDIFVRININIFLCNAVIILMIYRI